MDLDLDRVRLFIAAARHLNVSRAARERNISQPAATRHLKILQRDLGAMLYAKKGHGIILTAIGRTFYKDAMVALSNVEEVLKKYGKQNVATLTIAASHRPSKYLPPLISEFGKRHPQVIVSVKTHSSVYIEKLLLNGGIDLAIVTNPAVSESSFVSDAYCREPLTAFVAANHPLAQIKTMNPLVAGPIPVILKPRGESENLTEAQLKEFTKQGFQFRIVAQCDSPAMVKGLVRCGVGIGFLYYDSIKRGIESGSFKVIEFPGMKLVGENRIVYPKDKPLSPLVKEFLSLLRAALKKPVPVETIAAQPRKSHGSSRLLDHLERPKLLLSVISIAGFDWFSWL